MWTIFACGQKLSISPVTRSSKRAPIAISTSQSVHGHVGFVGTVHAEHAEVLRVGCRKRTQAHQGLRDRITQQTCEFGQFRCRIAQHRTATGVDHRPPWPTGSDPPPVRICPGCPCSGGLYERMVIDFGT